MTFCNNNKTPNLHSIVENGLDSSAPSFVLKTQDFEDIPEVKIGMDLVYFRVG